MTYSWQNEEGEPIMDGAAWRFEQQLDLDSSYDYSLDTEYGVDRFDAVEYTVENCTNPGDYTFLDGGKVRCDWCYTEGGSWVEGDDGWPNVTEYPH